MERYLTRATRGCRPRSTWGTGLGRKECPMKMSAMLATALLGCALLAGSAGKAGSPRRGDLGPDNI